MLDPWQFAAPTGPKKSFLKPLARRTSLALEETGMKSMAPRSRYHVKRLGGIRLVLWHVEVHPHEDALAADVHIIDAKLGRHFATGQCLEGGCGL